MTTEPFEPVASQSELAVVLGDLATTAEYATWPDWARAERSRLMCMHHGQRPPPMVKSLYAMAKNGVDLGLDGWAALGQAAFITARDTLNDIGQNGVAAQIVAIARRERGEAGDHPDPETDPAVDPSWAAFIPAEEPEEPDEEP